MRNRLWRRLCEGPRSLRREDGFGIVELTVAAGIALTALALLGGVLTAGITATGVSRARQSATGLANQTMEQIRALPFDTMARGLDATDLINTVGTSDTNVTTSGCGAAYCFGGERVVNNNNGAVDPLVPHTKTVQVGPTTFTIRSYVTNYQNSTTNGTYRVTVIVNWTSGVSGGAAKRVQVQTIIYTQPACLSTVTHTRSGPCQAAFTSSALAEPGTIELAGTLGGIDIERIRLLTGRATSDGTVEQTWRVTGVAQAAGATIKQVGASDEVTIGRGLVSSQADNEPGGLSPIYDAQTMGSQASASTGVSAGSDSITVATTGGDTGSTTSTTAACTPTCPAGTTPMPRTCPNIPGYTNENDSQPCGGSTSTSSSTVTANANMATLGSISLGAIGPQANPTTAITDRNIGPGTDACTSTPATGEGCTVSKLTRAAIDLRAGALPSNLNALLKPIGFTYFVQIQGVADSVSAEAGKSTGAPAAAQSAGSVRVWCAGVLGLLCPVTGYVTTAINEITGPLTVPTMTIIDATLGGGTTISLSATINPGSTSMTQSCSGTCDRTSATAKSQPPTVTMNYTITTAGTTRLNLSYTLDSGALTAKATYVPAPTS